MNTIKNFLQNASPKAKTVIFSGVFIFLAIIIVSIVNLIINSSQFVTAPVEITNFSESFDEITLPDYYQTQLQAYVWAEIMSTGNAPDTDFIPATIREGSIKKSDTDRYTALVDIEPLRYSFRVSFSYNPELIGQPYVEPGYYIECPYPDEIIYPDTPCPLSTPLEQVKRYLPIELSGNGFTEKAIVMTSSTGDYIMLKINTCNDDILSEGDLIFRNWLKKQYIDPNDLSYGITKVCPSNN